MKLSKLMHVISVVVGFAGVVTFIVIVLSGADKLVLGVTRIDALLCATVLILIAVWLQLSSIHHMMLEKKGEII